MKHRTDVLRRIRSGRQGLAFLAVLAALVTLVVGVSAASAADATAPVLAAASYDAPPDGNNNWRITTPQLLNLSATDDVAVAKFQYSLDGGLTYTDVPVTPGPSVSATVPVFQQGNTTLRYRAVDSSGNSSRGATSNTTLNQAAAAGATGVRLTSTTGRSAGDLLVIGAGATQETVTIASIPTPAPASPAPNVNLTTPLAQAHAAAEAVQGVATYLTIATLIDTLGPIAIWGTSPTTLNAAAAAGATEIRLASLTGRAVGDVLQLDQGANAELVTIASIAAPPPAAPAPNVVLTAALTKSHLTGSGVYVPAILDGKILQSQTLTPLRTDPRRRDDADTVSNGAGGAAPRAMTIDGVFMIPKTLQLNLLTVGSHTQTVTLQDTAGSVAKHTNTFVVSTSYDDLATVIDQYANNALRTTLNGAQAIGATGLRLASPFGFRPGQTLVVDTGDIQETVTVAVTPIPPPTVNTTISAAAAAGATEIRLANYTTATVGPNAPTVNGPIALQPIVLDTGANQEIISVARHIVPVPAAPLPNVVLTAPLTKAHAAGAATSLVNVTLTSPLTKAHATGMAVINPRPYISAETATALKALLTQAKDAAAAGNEKAARDALHSFSHEVDKQVKPEKPEHGVKPDKAEKKEDKELAKTLREALKSAASALEDELKGKTLDTTGTGVTVGDGEPGTQAIRVYWNPTPFTGNPFATYKILVNGRAGGFRHQSIVDFEAMFQELGAANGFDVEIWDPTLATSPGRQAPAGVSLAANPFLDLPTLMQYKTIVFNSTVGLNAQGLNATEFANLQAYVRAGGGVIAIHGGTDSMQNVPWYMDLVGAGFTNHGSNAGGILIETESGGHVQFVNADPGSPANAGMPDRFYTVEEVYNTNRDPVSTGIAHPLLYENEDSLIGQIGYGTGSLMNSDRHAMTWCRNFDGGRSFTTTLGHNWQFKEAAWFRLHMLTAVQWTAGVGYLNCVTYLEVSDLLDASVAAGGVNSAGDAVLSPLLAAAQTAFDAEDYDEAKKSLDKFIGETKKAANCTTVAGGKKFDTCPDGGVALGKLKAKGEELLSWAKGMK